MTTNDYWRKELVKAKELAPSYLPERPDLSPSDPDIVAALLIAQQLRELGTTLDLIRVQLNQIEDSLTND